MTQTKPAEPLPLLSLGRIMSEPLPEIEWEIDSLISRGDRGLIYGEWGAFKSWMALGMALCLAAGVPLFGHFSIPKARRVLYIDEEMNPRTLRRRVGRLALGMGLTTEEALKVPCRFLSRQRITLDETGAQKLLEGLKASDFIPEVIIIDTLRRVNLGDENDSKDVTAFWRNTEPLFKAGITVIVLHHMRKPRGKREPARHRASGSTDIMAAVDAALALERRGKDTILVTQVKSRDGEEQDPFYLRLIDDVEHTGPVTLEHAGTEQRYQAEEGETKRADRLLRDFINGKVGPFKTGDLIAVLGEQGISKRTAERAISKGGLLQAVKGQKGLWQHPPTANAIEESVAGGTPPPPSPSLPSSSHPSAKGSAKVQLAGGSAGFQIDPGLSEAAS